MNEHLNQVFEIILAELEKNSIVYWVYGGIAIAGIKGEYIRENLDIDVFVEEKYFASAENILNVCANKHNWIIKKTILNTERMRPKIEIFKDLEHYTRQEDMFSLVSIFRDKDIIYFVFPSIGIKQFSIELLTPVERKLNGFEFITPSNIFLRDLFYLHYNLLAKNPDRYSCHLKKYKYDKEYIDSLNF